MRYKIKGYTIYEYGNRKDSAGNKHQEDSIFPADKEIKDDDRLFILCDGMGGHEAGEVASAAVCEAMSDYILKFDPEGRFTDQNFQNALNAAYNALDQKDQGGSKKMGTTMTMLKLHDKGATIAHIGDSRVYQIRPGATPEETKIVYVTEDHSLVNDLIKIGELTPEQARTSKQKNVITRAMQPGEERRSKADLYHTVDILPGDYFYLCSDGMLEQATDDNLRFMFSNQTFDTAEKKVEALMKNSQNNDDNHSGIIVEILDVIDPLPITTKLEDDDNSLEAIIDDDDNEAPIEMAQVAPMNMNQAANISATPMRPVDPATRMQPAPKKKSNSLMYVVMALLIVILIAAVALVGMQLGWFGSKEQPKEEPKVETETKVENIEPARVEKVVIEKVERREERQVQRESANNQNQGKIPKMPVVHKPAPNSRGGIQEGQPNPDPSTPGRNGGAIQR